MFTAWQSQYLSKCKHRCIHSLLLFMYCVYIYFYSVCCCIFVYLFTIFYIGVCCCVHFRNNIFEKYDEHIFKFSRKLDSPSSLTVHFDIKVYIDCTTQMCIQICRIRYQASREDASDIKEVKEMVTQSSQVMI